MTFASGGCHYWVVKGGGIILSGLCALSPADMAHWQYNPRCERRGPVKLEILVNQVGLMVQTDDTLPCHYGADHYGACQYGESAMAHARLAQVQYDAGSIWRIPLWRSSSMAHSSMPQFRCGAVPVCRSFAIMSV